MPDLGVDDQPPPGWKRYAEMTWLAARFFRGFGKIGPRGPADGSPALVIPGFLAGDRTCMELRRALAAAGWRVHGWELGINKRVDPDLLNRLERCIDRMGAKQPVLVVGWSLGGLYARELARHCPTKVRAVVTLGSPFSGSLRQNNVWWLYEMVAGHSVDNPPIPPLRDKPPVPHLALWSRRDGIVAPRSARGLDEERDKEVEIGCSHMAFGISKNATRRVAREIEIFLGEVDDQRS